MFQANACSETVSILRAVIFGADGACIDIGLTSLLGGVALFIGLVVALRFAAAALLRRVFPQLRRKNTGPIDAIAQPPDAGLKRLPYESPIRSIRRWGRDPR